MASRNHYYVLTLREVSKKDYDNWNEGEALNGDENMSTSAKSLWEGSFEGPSLERPAAESTLKAKVEGYGAGPVGDDDVIELGQMW